MADQANEINPCRRLNDYYKGGENIHMDDYVSKGVIYRPQNRKSTASREIQIKRIKTHQDYITSFLNQLLIISTHFTNDIIRIFTNSWSMYGLLINLT